MRVIKFSGMILFVFMFDISAFSQKEMSGDINLERLIEAALSSNPGIKDGSVRKEISKKEINLSKSALFPSVSTDASYSFTNQNSIGNDYGSVSTGANLNQTLWQNGKNRALIKQSEFLHKAAQSEFEAQKQDLILKVKFSYFNLLRYKELSKISENNVAQAELFLEAAKEKNRLGIGKYSDILKAKSELADARYFLKDNNYSLRDAENELERFTGLEISADSLESYSFQRKTLGYEAWDSNNLLKTAINNYPELKSLENIESSQEFYIKAVKSDMYPNVSANAGYNWYYNPAFKSQDVWNAGITIRWNIFNGKSKENQVKIAQLRKQSYQYQKADLLVELKKEIANQLNALNETQDQIRISKILKKSTAENLKMLKEEYRQGISSMLELTNARTDDFNAKAKYINAITGYELAKAQLERIIGVLNTKN